MSADDARRAATQLAGVILTLEKLAAKLHPRSDCCGDFEVPEDQWAKMVALAKSVLR